ncbi:MAG: tRNA 2-thiocytidine biosynthesis TtcA family protein [Deltaproteobacteria bacterium]|jgi:tRNA(Ile)-lysidine synthase TilS/MesJ|nr:tRNA 2-thiocytidine biosynthesis TtcA family protein [Deltaproteobacteria bacterium]
MSREKLGYARKHCVKAAGKAMQQARMIHPGARVGVALSGGVDSFVLLKTLTLRRRIVPFRFDLMALHLNPGFDPHNHEELFPWLERNGIAAHVECTDYGPHAHSPDNLRRSPCFRCAWLRRKRLFELCGRYGLTHLALGHNADDLETTFFLNLFQNGRVDGLSMRESFFSGKLTLIRPLILVRKKDIAKAARQWDLPVWSNPCPSAGATRRSEMRAALEHVYALDPNTRSRVMGALTRRQLERAGPVDRLPPF